MTASNDYPHYPGDSDPGFTGGSSYGHPEMSDAALSLDNPGSFTVGQVFSTGWAAFKRNWVPFVLVPLAMIILYAIMFAVFGNAVSSTFGGADPSQGELSDEQVRVVLSAELTMLIPNFILSVLFNGFLDSSAVDAVNGKKVTVGNIFRIPGFLGFLGLMILTSVVTLIGFVFLIIPGIILTVVLGFVSYTYFTDPGAGIIAAVKRSIKIVKNNIGSTILLLIVSLLITAIGVMTIIGVLVVIPLMTCANAAVVLHTSGRGANAGDDASQSGAYGYHPENDPTGFDSAPQGTAAPEYGTGYGSSEGTTDTPWQGYPTHGNPSDPDDPTHR